MVLRPKLVLLLREIFQYWLCLRNTISLIPPRYRKSHGTSYYTTIYLIYIIIRTKIYSIRLFFLLNDYCIRLLVKILSEFSISCLNSVLVYYFYSSCIKFEMIKVSSLLIFKHFFNSKMLGQWKWLITFSVIFFYFRT